MAGRPKKKTGEKQTVETRETLEEKMNAFLKSGGKVDVIPTGISGQTNNGGTKHISLGNKK